MARTLDYENPDTPRRLGYVSPVRRSFVLWILLANVFSFITIPAMVFILTGSQRWSGFGLLAVFVCYPAVYITLAIMEIGAKRQYLRERSVWDRADDSN